MPLRNAFFSGAAGGPGGNPKAMDQFESLHCLHAIAAASIITFFGSFIALALPIALLMAVLLTAVGYFRQQAH